MPQNFNPAPIAELQDITPDHFSTAIRSNAEPVVLRGAVKHWPAVRDGSPEKLFSRLASFDTQKLQPTIVGKEGIKGKFHYSSDFKGQNYNQIPETLSRALERLLGSTSDDGTYIQSISIADHMPGFLDEHRLEIVPESVKPRAWIGTQTTVQTHFDTSENIACVVMGEREITIFPPDQLPALYPGPIETAPGGVMVSMTSLDNPDFETHPRFKEALKTARRAKLYPGDAIYIPYGWWHHIRAISPLNMLVNYWWTDQKAMLQDPYTSMFHAIMCFQHLRPEQAKVWQNIFSHFVFRQNGDPMAHVPAPAKGILAGVNPKDRERAIYSLLKTLGAHIGKSPLPPK